MMCCVSKGRYFKILTTMNVPTFKNFLGLYLIFNNTGKNILLVVHFKYRLKEHIFTYIHTHVCTYKYIYTYIHNICYMFSRSMYLFKICITKLNSKLYYNFQL